MKIERMSIEEIQQGYKDRRFTVTDVIKAYLQRIETYDDQINAFISVNPEAAIQKAKVLDDQLAQGEALGPLGGIPVAIKDNISTKGIKTTCGSKMLKDYVPPYDATIVKKLNAADAIIIGKTNMDEFAMGSSTENSAFFSTKNPWDKTKVPGGSSGGSAAAVASSFVPLSFGSDTGGSIRQPASFCSTVGLKPTYHLVSRYGLIAFASSLDQIGPFTTTVKDCARALNLIHGNDPMDGTTVDKSYSQDYLAGIEEDIAGMKFALPKEFFQQGLDQAIEKNIYEAVDKIKALGGIVEEVSLPIIDSGLSAYYIVSSAEASSNLARYDGIRYGYRAPEYDGFEELILNSRTQGFGTEVKRRIMLGTYVLSSGYYDAYYKRAMKLRQKISDSFKAIFDEFDVILSPTSPILPFNIGEKTSNPLEMYLADIYTVTINIAGIPAISLPSGFSDDGLPIGLQLIGDHFTEKKLLNVAYHLEQAFDIASIGPTLQEVD